MPVILFPSLADDAVNGHSACQQQKEKQPPFLPRLLSEQVGQNEQGTPPALPQQDSNWEISKTCRVGLREWGELAGLSSAKRSNMQGNEVYSQAVLPIWFF